MRRAALLALLLLAACSAPPHTPYVSSDWGFSASFPGPPKVTDYPASADGASRHAILVESVAAGRDDLVEVIDGRGSPKSEAQALDDAPGALARSVGGTLGPMTYAAAGQVVGREFTLSRPGRPPAMVRVFVRRQRLYEIIAASPLGTKDPMTSDFLDSFRLTG